MLETGVAALPTVAKLIRGFDGIVQKSRLLGKASTSDFPNTCSMQKIFAKARGDFW